MKDPAASSGVSRELFLFVPRGGELTPKEIRFFTLLILIASGELLKAQNSNDSIVNISGGQPNLFYPRINEHKIITNHVKDLIHIPLAITDSNNQVKSNYSSNTTLIGRWGYGPSNSIAVNGNFNYISSGCMFLIVDNTTASAPEKIGDLLLPDFIQDIKISGNSAYIADGDSGLRIIDISNPASPKETGFFDTPGQVSAVDVRGNYAFLVDENGLRIIDISNPANPQQVGFYNKQWVAHDLTVSENYVYIVYRTGANHCGMLIINVNNPASPQETGSYVISSIGEAVEVTVSGNYAYLAVYSYGLQIIDISNPASPQETGFCDGPLQARGVAISGNYAYVASGELGLRVINVSNPANPQEKGFYQTPNYAFGVVVNGNYAYIADGDYGLRIIDIINPENPQEKGFYNQSGAARGIAISGNYAYIADDSFLRIIDISNPAIPKETGFYDTPGWTLKVAISGNYAYVCDGWSGLRIIDISNPANPQEVGFYKTQHFTQDVAVRGNFAYTVDYTYGLRIIDISNPVNPQEIGFYNSPGHEFRVVVKGNYAYIVDTEYGLRIIDISNPANPQEIGFYNTPGSARGLAVSGNYIYIGNDSFLRIIDISNPTSPQEKGVYDTQGHDLEIAVNGNFAYVADGNGYLRIIDISNPTNPQQVGFYYTSGYPDGVAIRGNHAFIVDMYNGMFIIQNDLIDIPTIQATNITFSNVTNNQFTFNWTDGNGSKRAAFIKEGTEGSAFPVYDTTYTANTVFGSGSQIETTGWYCVFNGTTHPDGITVTNLSTCKTYRIMVCEYTGSPGSEIYNTSTAFKNPENVQTSGSIIIPTDGLIAWYPFNGNANDESGNGHNGTVNGTTLTTDRFGNPNTAYYFDGQNDNIITSFKFPTGNSPKSYSCWLKFSDKYHRGWAIGNDVGCPGTGLTSSGFGFYTGGNGKSYFFGDGGYEYDLEFTTNL